MNSVLNYSEEELLNLTSSELNSLLKEAEDGEVLFSTRQIVSKTSLNSLYGALANAYFPLFNQDVARAITGNGRYFIASLTELVNKRLSELFGEKDLVVSLYNDTDSLYITLTDFVEKEFKGKEATINEKTDWVDNFIVTEVQPIVQECIDTFAKDLNAFDKSSIGADREAIADSAVFCAKKKYFMRVLDNEGVRYAPFKIKVTGLEIARSSTPDFIKKKLKEEAILKILDGTLEDLQKWEKEVKEDFFNQPLEKISKASGVTSIDYDLKGKIPVPINSRASIVYNNYIKENNLEDNFALVTAEDNIRMLYLVTPNPFNSDIIAFKDSKFIEKFREFVDFDTNFDKYFRSPLEIMAKPAGFDLNKKTEELDEW